MRNVSCVRSMNLEVDFERLLLAEKSVRAELLAERAPGGFWPGRVDSSPVATAAAVSALVVAHQQDSGDLLRESATTGSDQVIHQLVQGDLSELLLESVHWLARRQNDDGGWGDCDGAESNLAATMLVQAAFRLTGIPAKYADLMVRADQYVTAQGGLAGLWKTYGFDKTYVAAVLANAALADMVPWRQVPTIQFEWLSLPRLWRRQLSAVAAQWMAPAALSVGLAKFHHDPTHNPITRLLRGSLRKKMLATLEQVEAADDSFEGSPLATSFVVMSIAGTGCRKHPIVERGIEFLLSSVRADASWAVTAGLATIHTCMTVEGLLARQRGEHHSSEWHDTAVREETATDTDHHTLRASPHDEFDDVQSNCWQWLLKTQHAAASKVTDAPAGGWGSSDAPGAEPNTIATAAALSALARANQVDEANRRRVERAASHGSRWLLEMQNGDGGWPTFTRDDESLPQSASGVDPTAQALRALAAWQKRWNRDATRASLTTQIAKAVARGIQFLESRHQVDGSFVPLWFGNEHHANDGNPVIGTAMVLSACEALQLLQSNMAARATAWLVGAQHSDGGWGPPRAPVDYSDNERDVGLRSWRENDTMAKFCSVEETSAAVAALLPLAESNPAVQRSVSRGLQWLAAAVEQDAHRRPAIIGFYWAKIWYYDRLSPLAWAAGTLSRAVAAAETSRSATTPVG